METTPQVERHLTASSRMKLKDVMIANLLGGISWGVGTVIGASLVVAILGYILRLLGVFEALGQTIEAFSQFNQSLRQF